MLDILMGASGGVFGIIGALVKHGLEVYQEAKREEMSLAVTKENNAHELAMADKRIQEITLEAQHATQLAQVAAAKEVDVAGFQALAASYDSDKATFSQAPTSPWMIAVDFCRGVIRQLLTLAFSVALVATTWWLLSKLPAETITDAKFLDGTFYRLVDAMIFLATSAVGWWFAARGVSKRE